MNNIEKAKMTLSYLSSNDGRLTETQRDKFIEYFCMPQPPYIPNSILDFPRYWYDYWIFLWANKKWEDDFKRENPLKRFSYKIIPHPRYSVTTVKVRDDEQTKKTK